MKINILLANVVLSMALIKKADASPILFIAKNINNIADVYGKMQAMYEIYSFFNKDMDKMSENEIIIKSSILLLIDGIKSNSNEINQNERDAIGKLTIFFMDENKNPEIKTNVASLIADFYAKKQEHQIAKSWYDRALGVKIVSGVFNRHSIEHLKLKAIAAAKVCVNEHVEIGERAVYCAVAYSYDIFSKNAEKRHIESLEKCVVLSQNEECAHHATRILSSLLERNDKGVSVKNDSKLIVAATTYAFLPYKKINENYQVNQLSNNEIIQAYWIATALEALNQYNDAKDIYVKICSYPNGATSDVGSRIKSACNLLINNRFWSLLTEVDKNNSFMVGCLKHDVPSLCVASLSQSELIKGNLFEFLSTISSKYISTRDPLYYMAYVLLFQDKLDTYIHISDMMISMTNSNDSEWDLLGDPEFYITIKTNQGITIYASHLRILRSDGYYYYIDAIQPSTGVTLPISSEVMEDLNIKIYELDETEKEVVLDLDVKIGDVASISNNLVRNLMLYPKSIPVSNLPINQFRSPN